MKILMISVPEEYTESLLKRSYNFNHKDTRVTSVWLQLVSEIAVYQVGTAILDIPKSVHSGNKKGVNVGCCYCDTQLLDILTPIAIETGCCSADNAEQYCMRYLSNVINDFILSTLKEAEEKHTAFEFVLAKKKQGFKGLGFSRTKYCEFVNKLGQSDKQKGH